MNIFKKIMCNPHDYKLEFTCTYRAEDGYKRIKIEKCTKCGKVKKSIV